MKAEATKIKMSAEYQREIQESLRRMSSKDIHNESDSEDDDDVFSSKTKAALIMHTLGIKANLSLAAWLI